MDEGTKYLVKGIAATIGFFFGFCLLVTLLCGGTMAFEGMITCHAKMEDVGMPYRWGFFKGCQVQTELGRWIPAERWIYGEIEIR